MTWSTIKIIGLQNDQWIVLSLSADTDLIAGAVSELTRVSQFHNLDLGLNLNLELLSCR